MARSGRATIVVGIVDDVRQADDENPGFSAWSRGRAQGLESLYGRRFLEKDLFFGGLVALLVLFGVGWVLGAPARKVQAALERQEEQLRQRRTFEASHNVPLKVLTFRVLSTSGPGSSEREVFVDFRNDGTQPIETVEGRAQGLRRDQRGGVVRRQRDGLPFRPFQRDFSRAPPGGSYAGAKGTGVRIASTLLGTPDNADFAVAYAGTVYRGADQVDRPTHPLGDGWGGHGLTRPAAAQQTDHAEAEHSEARRLGDRGVGDVREHRTAMFDGRS